MIAKLREFVKSYGYDVFVVLCIGLIAVTSYNLGKIQAFKKTPIEVGEADIFNSLTAEAGQTPATSSPSVPRDQRVVASKKSDSKVYHFTWCSGAKRIKEENKLWFETEAAAQVAGYTLAGNCQ